MSTDGSGPALLVDAAGDTVAERIEDNEVTARGFTATDTSTWSIPVKVTQLPLTAREVEVALEPDGAMMEIWIKHSEASLWTSSAPIP